MFYPIISEDSVLAITLARNSIEKNGPEWLDRRDCKYSPAIKKFLTEITQPSVSGGVVAEVEDLFEGNDEPEVLDRQIQRVINRMDAMEATLPNLEPNEKIAFFKAKTALLEKLITLREKTNNLREIAEFKAKIIAFLDEICSPDQITELMGRLK